MCFDMTQGLPISDKNIGAILASLSTHYFILNETRNLYKNIYDLLEESGYFIFRVNSVKEYIHNEKEDITETIEENYYRLKSGAVKRYFDISTMRDLLQGFKIIDITEGDFVYFGNKKYFIDGIAQKC